MGALSLLPLVSVVVVALPAYIPAPRAPSPPAQHPSIASKLDVPSTPPLDTILASREETVAETLPRSDRRMADPLRLASQQVGLGAAAACFLTAVLTSGLRTRLVERAAQQERARPATEMALRPAVFAVEAEKLEEEEGVTEVSLPDLKGVQVPTKAPVPSAKSGPLAPVLRVLEQNSLMVGIALAIALASLAPSVAATGGPLRAEFTIGRLGVFMVFLLNGLALPTGQLRAAALNWRLNALVQGLSMGATPFVFFAVAALLRPLGLVAPALLDGISAVGVLPTTVNMCVMLSTACGASTAVALFNAAAGNLLGTIITPLWLFQLFGTSVQISLSSALLKLGSRVLLPVAIGQVLRALSADMRQLAVKRKALFKRFQELTLCAILWNVFSDSFAAGAGGLASCGIRDLVSLLTLLPVLHYGLLMGCRTVFRVLGYSQADAVAGAFTSSHKTIALGIPVLKTVLDGHPDLALITAPLMMLHPIQLIVGSAVTPRFQRELEAAQEPQTEP